MALSGNSKITVSHTLTKSLDMSTPSDNLTVAEQLDLSSLTTAEHEADELWHDERSLGAGANETLDLSASVTDAFGDSVTFYDVKMLYIKNNSSTGTLKIGGAATNQFPLFADGSDVLQLPKNGRFLMQFAHEDGLVVDTNDQLKIENGDGSNAITYDIAIAGRSAAPTPTPSVSPTPTGSPSPTGSPPA